MNIVFFTISEALISLWRRRFVVGLAVFTIASSLFVLGIFAFITWNLNAFLREIQSRVSVEFFLRDTATKTDAVSLIEEIRKTDGVKSVDFVTKQDAMARFSKKFGQKLLSGLDENPFPPSIVAWFEPGTNIDLYVSELVRRFSTDTLVVQVASPGVVAGKLSLAARVFFYISIMWAIILIIGVSTVITNTIKLSISGEADAIEIMKLVGAEPAFIQAPFILEGFIEGAMAGIISSLVLWGVVYTTRQLIPSLIEPSMEILIFLSMLGAIFGVMGSKRAVKKYIRM